ncbi:hypothetical protein AAF712_014106 [Marasmius tenuissimus]|uniref:Uncharacterized protein n=1 Tax=Marasmius tenuissimus TaxID=585030 RepID=A0ABR2ZD80_9AGAR
MGKRVAIVGTGASGVQVIQEVSSGVSSLTVFQQTPDFCLPMRQSRLDVASQMAKKKSSLYGVIYRQRPQTTDGLVYTPFTREYGSLTPKERILHLEETWETGEFVATALFPNTITNQETNDAVYEFWKNKDNVELVDLNENPIAEFTTKGIVTGDGQEHEFDIIVLATGFDSVTGAITNMSIRGLDGKSVSEAWKNGVYNLGMTISGFPNMFFTYGLQAPTALTNGPSCVETQGNWIAECIHHMLKNKLATIEATKEAEQTWRDMHLDIQDKLLFKKARGWWNRGNIPGKTVEFLTFAGRLTVYLQTCKEKAKEGYEGFVLASKST